MTVTAAEARTRTAFDADDSVPVRSDGVELLGEISGSGYRTPPSLVRRGDGQTFQLTRLVWLILHSVDGRLTYDDIAEEVSGVYGRRVTAEDVRHLVDRWLRPLGLLQRADGPAPELKRSNPLLALRFRYVVADPDVTRRVTAPFAWLFHPIIVTVVVAGFVAVTAWTLFTKGLASATHQAFDEPGLLLAVFLLSVVSAGFHEFGHAAAARYGGATPGGMGVGLYLIWPAFYTDVTDSYRLGRGGRLRTDLGGLYFNAIVAIAMFGAWWVSRWDALLLIIAAQVLQMVRQLAPLLRFDGYHVLADLTGVPDLYQRIKPTLLGLLPTRWGDPESKALKPWARAVVTLWVLLVVPLLIGIAVLMVVGMPRIAATAWAGLSERWQRLSGHVDDGEIAGASAQILSILAIVIPLAAMVYIAARAVRRLSATVWRATAGRPGRRVGAEVTAFAIVVVLAWAWWPGHGDYRPVQAYERGTIGDAVSTITDPGAVTEGRSRSAESVWSAADDDLPTRDRPVLAVVLVPADPDADAPTWVFPFDRPLPPGEGDNQAMAINTDDGTIVYDVAFALVWVTDGSLANRNEAYALASCTDCAAVAVGFQVVLALGQVNVAVPENVSAAINYACVRCVTYALAWQLVVTLPGGLSGGAFDQLAALWEEIRRFGEQIEDVPLAELQSRLRGFEQRILEIVRRDSETAAAAQRSSPDAPPPTSPSNAPTTTADRAGRVESVEPVEPPPPATHDAAPPSPGPVTTYAIDPPTTEDAVASVNSAP